MNLRKKSLRGSLVLTAGEAVVYGLAFGRNMMLARLLTKADFGMAATFAMVITLLEFSSKMGVSRFVIRDKDGGQAEFVASTHVAQAVIGFLSSLIMVAASWPLAHLFGIVEHQWALWVLAVIPIFNGLHHLDVRRFERDLRFGPAVATEVAPQVVITLAAWPLAVALGDFRVMLCLLVTKSVMSCLATHVLAERPYRWRVDRAHLGRLYRFGWPLVVASLLLFGVLQGEQFLVATFYSMADLGPYAAAVALTTAPSFILARIFNSMMLPLMARDQDNRVAFGRRYGQATGVITVFCAGYAVFMITACEAIMVLVYGSQYVGSGTLLGMLVAANSFRTLRLAPTVAAMAKGDTKNQMICNIWRLSALVPALGLAVAQQPIIAIALTGIFGEVLAHRAALWRLRRRDGVSLVDGLRPIGFVAASLGLAALAHQLVSHHAWWEAIAIATVLSLGTAGLIIVVLPALRSEARRLLARPFPCLCWSRSGTAD